MKVLIPLAGFGTRLRPHTYTKPKPLVNVAGKPVLGHILDKLVGLDLEEVIFITGYLGDKIADYVSANYSFPTRYFEQKELNGQSPAIYLAREHLQGPCYVIFVDTIFEADLTAAPTDVDGIIYTKEVPDPRRFGVAVTEGGFVTKLIEKPKQPVSNQAMIGIYYFREGQDLISAIRQQLSRNIQTQGEYYLADAVQLMIDSGARMVSQPVEVWEDCGKPETVLQTNRYLLTKTGGYCGHSAEGFIIVPPVYIAASAVVERSVIGPYVTIAEDATVRNSIVKDSIINQGAHIQDAMLSGSLIGDHAQVRGTFEQLNVGDSSQVEPAANGGE
jgi:glucose-1-phosphate thymidylyltransferase